MREAVVIGHVVAEARHEALAHCKILIVGDVAGGDVTGRHDVGGDDKPLQLAVDAVGAGIGDRVLVTESGTAAAEVTRIKFPPVRSVIVGIVDVMPPREAT